MTIVWVGVKLEIVIELCRSNYMDFVLQFYVNCFKRKFNKLSKYLINCRNNC